MQYVNMGYVSDIVINVYDTLFTKDYLEFYTFDLFLLTFIRFFLAQSFQFFQVCIFIKSFTLLISAIKV